MQKPSERCGYLARVEAMLASVFDVRRYSGHYLPWQYDENPDGGEIVTDLFAGDEVSAHYVVIPQIYRTADGRLIPMVLSLNTAVTEKARGKGVFTSLANATYDKARAAGYGGVLGVGNAKSTHGLVKSLGFQLLGPLRVKIGVALPFAGRVKSAQVTRDYLASTAFHDTAQSIAQDNKGGITYDWSFERLRWRLGSPYGRYWIHESDDGIVASTVEVKHGIPFAVILKFWPKAGRVAKVGVLLRAACRTHKTILYVYAGYNPEVHIGGFDLPVRLRPSPLNLVYKKLALEDDITLDRFEFLDFDAY